MRGSTTPRTWTCPRGPRTGGTRRPALDDECGRFGLPTLDFPAGADLSAGVPSHKNKGVARVGHPGGCSRLGKKLGGVSRLSTVPAGLRGVVGCAYPAMNRWAKVRCAYGAGCEVRWKRVGTGAPTSDRKERPQIWCIRRGWWWVRVWWRVALGTDEEKGKGGSRFPVGDDSKRGRSGFERCSNASPVPECEGAPPRGRGPVLGDPGPVAPAGPRRRRNTLARLNQPNRFHLELAGVNLPRYTHHLRRSFASISELYVRYAFRGQGHILAWPERMDSLNLGLVMSRALFMRAT